MPELAGPSAAYRAAHSYLREAPPHGRVRCYPTNDETATIVRADGDGWSLIGRTGPAAVAYILLDTAPNAIHAAKGPKTTELLKGLAELTADDEDKKR